MVTARPYLVAAVADIVRGGGRFTVRVKGGSMRPLLQDGDHVILDPEATPAAGSIVAFQRATHFVVHRLIERGAEGWVEAGDAEAVEGSMNDGDVLGVACEVQTPGGRRVDLGTAAMRWHGRLAVGSRRLGRRLPAPVRHRVTYLPRLVALLVRGLVPPAPR